MAAPPPHPELESIVSMLSAFSHRNKNQHRLSKWWKPFSQLRRHISSLVSELEVCHNEEQRYGARHKKGVVAREAVERRAGFLIVSLAPRAFLAFSMLVADNQYAALGLMLLATLARVRKLVLPLMGSKAEDVEGAMDIQEHGGLDLGEVIQRNEIVGGSAKEDEEDVQAGFEVKKPKEKRESREQEPHLNRPIDSTPTKRPKKKRKKGDAFDDIFDSLI